MHKKREFFRLRTSTFEVFFDQVCPYNTKSAHSNFNLTLNWHFFLVFRVFGVLSRGGQMGGLGGRVNKKFQGSLSFALIPHHTLDI